MIESALASAFQLPMRSPFAAGSTALAQLIAAIYATGQPGAWYDPSEAISAPWYQDSAGTTPITAVEQPIGLALDKSRGLALSADLITVAADRDFSADTGFWTKGPGVTVGGGVANFAAAGDGSGFYRFGYLTIGKYYEITYTIATCSAGAIGIGFISGTGTLYATGTPGTYTRRILAGTAELGILNVGVTTGTVDNISVKEVLGNHAIQATAAARAILRQDASGYYYEAFDGIDDSLSSATGGGGTTGFFWSGSVKPIGGAGTNRTLWSDAGTNTGYRVRINAANQLELAAAQAPTYGATLITNGSFATDTVWTKGAGWTIAAGMATGTVSSASITQAATLTAGKRYEITYTAVTPTAGTVQLQLQGGTVVSGTARSTAGTYTEVLMAADGNTTLGFLGATWSGSIDNVIIREITYYVLATTTATVDVGTTNIVTVWDDGVNLNAQIGNGAVASVARPVVLAGTAGFTRGKDNGVASGFLNGGLYTGIYRKDSGLTVTERSNAKRYVASKSGVTL